MFKSRSFIFALTFGLISGFLTSRVALADNDPLLLSPADMQKLQHYFPDSTTPTNLQWNGTPLTIALPIGKEKRIIFPERVSLDIRSQLTSAQLKVTNDDQELYLTALTPFSTTRVYVTLLNSNQVVLLDLTADNTASAQPVKISVAAAGDDKASNAPPAGGTGNVIPTGEIYLTLTRYAWQQLYAPPDLVKSDARLSRAPMQAPVFISHLIYGDKVLAHPLASWQWQNTYITAVELRNKYTHSTTINITRDICGAWQAAMLYPHRYLAPLGNKKYDSTTLFLISDQPFMASLEQCHAPA